MMVIPMNNMVMIIINSIVIYVANDFFSLILSIFCVIVTVFFSSFGLIIYEIFPNENNFSPVLSFFPNDNENIFLVVKNSVEIII